MAISLEFVLLHLFLSHSRAYFMSLFTNIRALIFCIVMTMCSMLPCLLSTFQLIILRFDIMSTEF